MDGNTPNCVHFLPESVRNLNHTCKAHTVSSQLRGGRTRCAEEPSPLASAAATCTIPLAMKIPQALCGPSVAPAERCPQTQIYLRAHGTLNLKTMVMCLYRNLSNLFFSTYLIKTENKETNGAEKSKRWFNCP